LFPSIYNQKQIDKLKHGNIKFKIIYKGTNINGEKFYHIRIDSLPFIVMH